MWLCNVIPATWCGQQAMPSGANKKQQMCWFWPKSLRYLVLLVFYASSAYLRKRWALAQCECMSGLLTDRKKCLAALRLEVKLWTWFWAFFGCAPLTLKKYKSPFYSIYLAYLHFNQVVRQASAFRVSWAGSWQKEHNKGGYFCLFAFFLFNLDAY